MNSIATQLHSLCEPKVGFRGIHVAMAKKTNKKVTKPKTEHRKKQKEDPGKTGRGKRASTQQAQKPKARLDRPVLEKAIADVEAANPGENLSPAQVRTLVMRGLINLGDIAQYSRILTCPEHSQGRDSGAWLGAL